MPLCSRSAAVRGTTFGLLPSHEASWSMSDSTSRRPLLHEARSRGSKVTFVLGDAAKEFPFPNQRFGFTFAVDVIHHIEDLSCFFAEVHRVLVPGGHLMIVTDSRDTLKRRSLTAF